MIETEYSITYADYKAAQWLYLWKRPWKMILYWTSHLGWAALAACLVGWFFASRKVPEAGLKLWLDCGTAFFVAFFVNQGIRAMQLRRCYGDSYSNTSRRTVRLIANDKELRVAVPGRSESRLQWNAIDDVAEDSEVRLLFVGKTRFMIVPRRALNETQWAELRALITTKLDPAAQ
jgi:YcxB-like protein